MSDRLLHEKLREYAAEHFIGDCETFRARLEALGVSLDG